ncbi:titan9 [Striga hermonthica]|uniref:Titan9 n=1 Tax=Striga hermonthica TaxID=68872 RepID=A0A9N7MX80_STRHE|nr:titan9 [Striga hermonthica]
MLVLDYNFQVVVMEALYRKLYEKYSKLKNEKESQFDRLNYDQEVKFLNFEAAADEMIQYLKSENDKLIGQVDELKSELTSIRSSSQEKHSQDQKLLNEQNQKIKELSEEIARLQSNEHNQCSYCTVHGEIRPGEDASHDDTPSEGTSRDSVKNLVKKRKTVLPTEVITATPSVNTESDHLADQRVHLCKPVCCEENILHSDGHCVYRNLVEFVIGMKVSPIAQSSGELSVLARHPSSGYSFSLTWIKNLRGEVELMYNVLSLGTIERVAHEWMKETIIFSTNGGIRKATKNTTLLAAGAIAADAGIVEHRYASPPLT